MHQIENNAPADVSKVILGTKSDLLADRQVSTSEAEALAAKYSISYVEVSSKTGENVKEAIDVLVK